MTTDPIIAEFDKASSWDKQCNCTRRARECRCCFSWRQKLAQQRREFEAMVEEMEIEDSDSRWHDLGDECFGWNKALDAVLSKIKEEK